MGFLVYISGSSFTAVYKWPPIWRANRSNSLSFTLAKEEKKTTFSLNNFFSKTETHHEKNPET